MTGMRDLERMADALRPYIAASGSAEAAFAWCDLRMALAEMRGREAEKVEMEELLIDPRPPVPEELPRVPEAAVPETPVSAPTETDVQADIPAEVHCAPQELNAPPRTTVSIDDDEPGAVGSDSTLAGSLRDMFGRR